MMVQVDTRDNATMYAGSQFGAYARPVKTMISEKEFVRDMYWERHHYVSIGKHPSFYRNTTRMYFIWDPTGFTVRLTRQIQYLIYLAIL